MMFSISRRRPTAGTRRSEAPSRRDRVSRSRILLKSCSSAAGKTSQALPGVRASALTADPSAAPFLRRDKQSVAVERESDDAGQILSSGCERDISAFGMDPLRSRLRMAMGPVFGIEHSPVCRARLDHAFDIVPVFHMDQLLPRLVLYHHTSSIEFPCIPGRVGFDQRFLTFSRADYGRWSATSRSTFVPASSSISWHKPSSSSTRYSLP